MKSAEQLALERLCRDLGKEFTNAIEKATEGTDRQIGFLVMLFDFGEGGFNAYFSNAHRADIVNLLKEQIALYGERMNLPWIDIETTGLDEQTDAILEIGVVITNEKLEQIASKNWVIKPSRDRNIRAITPYVVEMHQKSGLWLESLSSTNELAVIYVDVADFIRSHTDKAPACGSSVHFDRRFLKAQCPAIDEAFHYRNIDVSTLKNLCAIYCPEANETAPEPSKKHRAIDDIADSIALLKHYLNYLTFPGFQGAG